MDDAGRPVDERVNRWEDKETVKEASGGVIARQKGKGKRRAD